MHDLFAIINFGADQVTSAASQPWIYFLVALICLVDGVFPPIPSEVVVLAMASLALGQGGWTVIPLLFAAAGGAFLGDFFAFGIGRRARRLVDRRPSGKVTKALNRFGARLVHQGATLILTARFIPVGRVAVNMAAGSSEFQTRRFWPIAAFASLVWAVYMIGIGALFGLWFRENPLIGVLGAIVFSTSAGLCLDVLAKRRRHRDEQKQLASVALVAAKT